MSDTVPTHVVVALRAGSYPAARLVAREYTDGGHALRALATRQEWSDHRLLEEIAEHPDARSFELIALRAWTLHYTAITSVQSCYGHRFMGDDGYQSCLTCGARYEQVHDDPDNVRHGRYTTSNGDDPESCTGDTSMIHGDRHETGHELECESGCEHCHHGCNCLLCTG